MNKKKLIGTIIGVIMFGLLMAGATYAWLSFNATVVNARYNGYTMNYWVDYEKGTNLSDMPILSSTATPGNATVTKLTAKKPTGSLADHVNLHLTTESSNLLTEEETTSGSGVYLDLEIINYAVCEGTSSASNCTTNFANAVKTGVVNMNEYRSTTDKTIDLYTDTISTSAQYYYIYFWIDAEPLLNKHINLKYEGYLHASANQSAQTQK